MICKHCYNSMVYEEARYGLDIAECWRCIFCGELFYGRMLRGKGNSIPHNDVVNEPIFPRLNGQGRFGNYGGKIRRIG